MVSIVIPTYNRVKFLVRSINSVYAQTCKNFEVIVVNDGSTDNTAKALKKYSWKYDNFTAINEQKNKGVASARNIAIEVAKGDYIAFLDDDDVWLNDKLETQVKFHKKKNVKFSHMKRDSIEVIDFDRLLDYDFITSSIMVDRDLILDRRFDESLRVEEDYKLFLELSLEEPMRNISGLYVHYNSHEEGRLTEDLETMWKNRIDILSSYPESEKASILKQEYQKYLNEVYGG